MQSSITAGIEKEFNTDLLLNDDDLKLTREKYPDIAHVLDHAELRAAFSEADVPANRAKIRSYRSGYYAVLCGVACLATAAATPLLHGISRDLLVGFSGLSALLGVISVVLLHSGSLHGSRKSTWMRKRFLTERIRQFFFQSLVCKLVVIIDSMEGTKEAVERFEIVRATEFRSFLKQHSEVGWLVSNLTGHIDRDIAFDPWLFEDCQSLPNIDEGKVAPVLEAYRELRFKGQRDYANWMLRTSRAGVRVQGLSLLQKRKVLHDLWSFLFISLVLIHVVILVGSVMGWGFIGYGIVHVTIIWIALAAIGVRTLEHGMSLHSEIARYKEHRAEVIRLLHAFDEAKTVALKVEQMKRMEMESVRELRAFLRQHAESSFVI